MAGLARTQVKLTDVRAVEDCLATLQASNLETELNLSANNCVQIFRMLQLGIEYVWHLRNAHTSLLEQYSAATAAAGRCVSCAAAACEQLSARTMVHAFAWGAVSPQP
jgi:hypothetical protein